MRMSEASLLRYHDGVTDYLNLPVMLLLFISF